MASREEEIRRLFKGIQKQLNQDWARFRDQHHNPSNKGGSYEEALGDLLEKYFWGVYEIRTQSVIIDEDLDVFDSFDTARGENEIDVVGLFESARPRIVFEVEDMTYAPLRGTAFLCEVKSEVDSERLEKDLSKLRKVTDLMDMNDTRWGVAQTGPYTTSHQIRCLVYDGRSISDEGLVDLAIEYSDSWDLMLIVEEDTLLMNDTLPIFEATNRPFAELDIDEIDDDNIENSGSGASESDTEEAVEKLKSRVRRETNFATLQDGLVYFLIVLSASIPRPLGVDTADALLNLLYEYRDLSVPEHNTS